MTVRAAKSEGVRAAPSATLRAATSETLRAATYNVNSVRARLPLLVPWLERVNPDIVCLQETKVADALFPVAAFRDLGFHAIYRGDKAYNGVAILSKRKPTRVGFGFADGGPADEARLAAATLGDLRVVNAYIPQGRAVDDPMFGYKLEWFARLRRFFATTCDPSEPVLWVGDFNVAPEPIDVHDPKRLLGHVCFSPDARDALAKVRAWGFDDVFRRHVAAPDQYTFFDYRVRDAVDRHLGWRVDHIWATESLAAKSTRAWIDLEPRRAAGTSDHAPLLAEFEI